METKIVKLGFVGVDSGQLLMCDPCQINSEFIANPVREETSNHRILKHKDDGILWQFCYRNLSEMSINPYPGVFPFPGSYMDVIPKYNKTPNELIESGDFIESEIDPMGNIPDGEFSYDGICKSTQKNENHGGQLKYSKGHDGEIGRAHV